jgi:hypothetical protein
MKNASRVLSCLLITIISYTALAQTGITISQALDYWISNCEKEVVSAADAMPEAKYSFAPTAGEFTGARTFAEQIKHLAANNYRMAARISGRRPRLIRRPRPDPMPSDQSLKSLTTSKARSLRCIDPRRR